MLPQKTIKKKKDFCKRYQKLIHLSCDITDIKTAKMVYKEQEQVLNICWMHLLSGLCRRANSTAY